MAELNGWRTRPMYTIGETAKLAGVAPSTVRDWLRGYGGAKRKGRSLLGEDADRREGRAAGSFLHLGEIVGAKEFRRRGVSPRRLYDAHEYARDKLKIDYPFVSVPLLTDGRYVLKEFEDRNPDEDPKQRLLALDESGQLTLPGHVVEAIERF